MSDMFCIALSLNDSNVRLITKLYPLFKLTACENEGVAESGNAVKQGKSVIWLFLKINNHISGESQQDLSIVDRFKTKLCSHPVSTSYLKQVWDYLKQGFARSV